MSTPHLFDKGEQMVRALGKTGRSVALARAVLALFGFSAFAQEDPPSRVARLSHIEGNVSMEPAGADDWAPAVVNHPFTIGDYLYTDQGARAELHMDVAVMRMGPQTSFGFLNLGDQSVQIKLAEGDMYFRLYNFPSGQTFEVDTPNAAVTLLGNGIYRFRVDPNGNASFVVVRQGQAQVSGGGQAFTMNAGDSANLSGTDQLSYDVEAAPAPDDFDNWSAERDAREERAASRRYLPPTVVGYEDLDDYGSWQQASDYGPVWYPRQVAAGWAPYHDGHWAWVDPWGWSWVDAAPWGFAPFHYGRWAYISGRWGWAPGPIAIGYRGGMERPYYAPALVAWFGGSHWGVSVSIGGGGPSLGWLPLGYGEVYTPPYVCSETYFNDVNIYNTPMPRTVNIANVYNTVYVNHAVYNRQFTNARAPGAVMAMSQTAFASGRPVRQAAMPVRQADLGRIQGAAVVAPPVAPRREALAATMGRSAPRPPAQVMQRQVVARNKPPAAPAPFTARQQYLQQHAGQLHNYQAMHQAVAPRVTTAALVRQAPAARPVAAHVGERVGHPVAAARPGTAAQPGHAAPAAQPGRTAAEARQPAAHGTASNMRPGTTGQPAENARGAERTPRGQPAARSTPVTPRNETRPAGVAAQPRAAERPAARTPQPAPARPAERAQPKAAAQPRAAERPAARTAQPASARPAERAQPKAAARPAERTATPARQPAARTPQPAAARPAERAQPKAAARPAAAPKTAARPATAPKAAARPATAPKAESRPAPAPQAKRAPPPAAKNTKNTKDTKH